MKKNYIQPQMTMVSTSHALLLADSLQQTSDPADPNYPVLSRRRALLWGDDDED